MNCCKVRNCMADYGVGLLSGKTRAEVASHLRECADCRGELEKQERVMLLVEDLASLEPPVGLWNGVHNRINATPVHPSVWTQLKEGHYRRRARWSAGFATVALTALILYLTSNVPHRPAGIEAQEYLEGHASYASQDVLADQAALYTSTVVAERVHSLEGETL